jgi:hypothetical protein
MLVSLQGLREECSDSEIKRSFGSFTCSRDKDIEYFFKRNALRFEKASKSRTYLYLDDTAFEKDELKISAFFTMAPQVLMLPKEMTEEQIKELDGCSGTIHGEKLSALPVMLIGQLARADEYNAVKRNDEISGANILKDALGIANESRRLIGGRIVMVDVKTESSKLIRFYEENGFRRISDDEKTGLSQMIYAMTK